MEAEKATVESSPSNSAANPTSRHSSAISRRPGDLDPKRAWELSGFSPNLLRTIGRPPVLSTEDQSDYYELVRRISDSIHPQGWVEKLLVKDFADIAWELSRLGRTKTEMINMASLQALKEILKSIVSDQTLDDEVGDPDQLVVGWPSDVEKRQKILEIMGRHGLDESSITAYAITLRSDEIECHNRMIAFAESRRRAVLREIEYYRKGFSELMRTTGVLNAAE